MLPKPNAPPSGRTRNPRIDQFDSCALKSGNQFHERIDVGSDHAIAGFHALNGGNGKVRQIGGLPLVYIQERAGGPELVGRDHEIAASSSVRIEYAYTIQITASSIILDTKYIITPFAPFENGSRPETVVSNYSRRMWRHYPAKSGTVGGPQIT
jgi:hypothetical protein